VVRPRHHPLSSTTSALTDRSRNAVMASHTGSRLERVWRDVSQAWGHVNFILHDWTTASYSMHEFGTLPPPGA
jgi:hypothetical protein